MPFDTKILAKDLVLQPGAQVVLADPPHNMWASYNTNGLFSVQAESDGDVQILIEYCNDYEVFQDPWHQLVVLEIKAGIPFFKNIDLYPSRYLRYTAANAGTEPCKLTVVPCYI